mgnify:CR=1 FL=1
MNRPGEQSQSPGRIRLPTVVRRLAHPPQLCKHPNLPSGRRADPVRVPPQQVVRDRTMNRGTNPVGCGPLAKSGAIGRVAARFDASAPRCVPGNGAADPEFVSGHQLNVARPARITQTNRREGKNGRNRTRVAWTGVTGVLIAHQSERRVSLRLPTAGVCRQAAGASLQMVSDAPLACSGRIPARRGTADAFPGHHSRNARGGVHDRIAGSASRTTGLRMVAGRGPLSLTRNRDREHRCPSAV